MGKKETDYKALHRSRSDDNDHVSLFGDDDKVAGHVYPDGSRKTFMARKKED